MYQLLQINNRGIHPIGELNQFAAGAGGLLGVVSALLGRLINLRHGSINLFNSYALFLCR